jgi:hypothetical protein
MTEIRVHETQVSEAHALADLQEALEQTGPLASRREILPATAVTIASWWQSAGNVGRHLAAFASGSAVDRTALLDDIAATRRIHGRNDALDCLATFIIDRRAEEVQQ